MMLLVKSWVVGLLMLSLPVEWEPVASGCEQVSVVHMPDGPKVRECVGAWRTAQGGELHVFVWRPGAPRDGGPMVAAESWTVPALGQDMKIVRTSTFMGVKQEVLTTAFALSAPERADVLIYAKGVTREAFAEIVETLKLAGDD